jgi:cell division protein FtsA
VPIAEGQQIRHTLPQYFIIDGQERVSDPVGMCGVRLEVQAHIITGALASVQNLVKCCEQAGVKVADIVLEQLASASAVLSRDERELGVAVLDSVSILPIILLSACAPRLQKLSVSRKSSVAL